MNRFLCFIRFLNGIINIPSPISSTSTNLFANIIVSQCWIARQGTVNTITSGSNGAVETRLKCFLKSSKHSKKWIKLDLVFQSYLGSLMKICGNHQNILCISSISSQNISEKLYKYTRIIIFYRSYLLF